ncbi:hypothetical protein FRC19_005904 [Serendipita sp. 401]|nr:hypothetical protein FRC19_005904 [Serendipita sp. 401]
MSRRESRNSLGARQSNTLEEFENFKKKYLLVNKHIAKLNSSLNVRIEELLSQIAALNIENLRLKTSELRLARKLENEKAKIRKLYTETETASQLFMAQITSIRTSFGLDKPQGPSQFKELSAASSEGVLKTLPCPIPRLARPPEVESITEATEEDASTPTRPPRHSSFSPPASTPVSRRRSTGSTPTPISANASGRQATPGSVDEGSKVGSVNQASSVAPPISGSSPLTPCPYSMHQSAGASSSPISPTGHRSTSSSPSSTQTVEEKNGTEENEVTAGIETSNPPVPHLNLNGMKRVIRRPSGLVKSDTARPPLSNPPPPSLPCEPRTPPKSKVALGVSGTSSPITPTRSIPMSPVLTANPALSPPPNKKPSLARRQLDFGITDSDEEEEEDDDLMETNNGQPIGEGLLSFQSDSVIGKRAPKRKNPENEEEIAPSITMRVNTTRRRQEKRRDTGTVVPGAALMEKTSIDSLLKDRNSKDSLRDVTNGRVTNNEAPERQVEQPTIAESSSTAAAAGPVASLSSRANTISTSGVDVAGIAAKLERISTKPPPPAPLATLPLPLSDKDVKISLAPEEEAYEDNESNNAASELSRRNSGRQRRSINYKEPSLLRKMRKPDPLMPPGSEPSTQSTSSFILTATATLQKAPKRKKGSISLIDEITPAEGAPSTAGASEEAVYTPSLKDEGSGTKPIIVQRSLRKAVWDRYPDLSDEERPDKEEGADANSNIPPGNGGYITSTSSISRASFSGLRGTSILARGSNPIISGSAPSASSIVDIVGRNFAALKVAPGAARERVREEMSGMRRVAPKEKEKEKEEEGRGLSPTGVGIAI